MNFGKFRQPGNGSFLLQHLIRIYRNARQPEAGHPFGISRLSTFAVLESRENKLLKSLFYLR